jgi:hypothetical protein
MKEIILFSVKKRSKFTGNQTAGRLLLLLFISLVNEIF